MKTTWSPFHPAESAAAAAVGTSSLAMLLSRHILRDGELVLLIAKPSLWFVFLSSLRFMAGVVIAMCAAVVLDDRHRSWLWYADVAIFLVAGRLGWAVLQWMGRLYILTDLRIVTLGGVFSIDIFDCPLRRVASARLLRPARERSLGLGSIEVMPCESAARNGGGTDRCVPGLWQTVARPVETHDQIVAAISRAKA